jgi:hypothetical protein
VDVPLCRPALLGAFDNPDIPNNRVAEQLPRGLIRGALICGDRGRQVVKFHNDRAPGQPGFKSFPDYALSSVTNRLIAE